jgi:RNA polymerase sigma factor for flagellar operon FliA
MGLLNTKPDTGRLVEAHRSYAHAVAAEVVRRMPHTVEKSDLLAAAELGLVEAAAAYDPARGVQFKTFSYYRIKGAVYDCLRKMGWFSKSQYDQYRFEVAANEYMKDYSSATPPPGSPAEDYEELKGVSGTIVSCYLLSLDSMSQEGGAYEIAETAPSPEDSYQAVEEHDRLRKALTELPDKNRQILECYYYQELSLEEIGTRLGLSKSWVCRMHAKSLEMVRAILDRMPAAQATLATPAR